MLARSDYPITVPSAHAATPEWLAARAAWFAHHSGCDLCRKYHQQPALKRGPNPCSACAELLQRYENEPIFTAVKK